MQQAKTVPEPLQKLFDKLTLDLISRDVAFTILAVLSQLISLQSSMQSVGIITGSYKEDGVENSRPQPAATAMAGTVVGIVSVVGLVWVAYDRLQQQKEKTRLGFDTVSLWPQVLIVVTGFVLIVMAALRAIAVQQKVEEEARVVIL